MLGSLLATLIQLYLLVLVVRAIYDLVLMTARDWRPQGILLVIANVVYTLTDPPLRWMRKIIPLWRVGGVAIDLGFIVLFIGLQILSAVVVQVF